MSHIKNGRDYDYGSGPGGGLGNMHGKIGSPLDPCGYDITPNAGGSGKGGEPNGPFGQYTQSSSPMTITTRDTTSASPQQGFGNLGSGGKIVTPMDTSTAMPGVSGQSSGSGPTSGGGAKISSPFSSPWGDSVG